MRDRSGSAGHRPLSRTILRDVLDKGKAIVIADSVADPRFQLEDSVISSVRTALCVPLLGHDGRPLGMIQLDSQKLMSGFKTGDLDLLATLTVPISVAIENYRLLQEHASWAAAREIQLALLPQRRPQIAGYAFWECYQPSMAVGGDFYDYIEIEPARTSEKRGTRWAVTLGDVVGKGMPAALLAANVCPEVRHLVGSGVSPEQVLGRVNRRIFDAGVEAMFVTMILIEVDADSHSMIVVNAGHAAPLLRARPGEVVPIAEQGARLPLGVDPHTVYQPVTIPLEPGDLIVALHRRRHRRPGQQPPAVWRKAVAAGPGRGFFRRRAGRRGDLGVDRRTRFGPVPVRRRHDRLLRTVAGLSQWSVVSGQWSVVSGQLSVVSGQLSVVSCQLSVASCQWWVLSADIRSVEFVAPAHILGRKPRLTRSRRRRRSLRLEQ